MQWSIYAGKSNCLTNNKQKHKCAGDFYWWPLRKLSTKPQKLLRLFSFAIQKGSYLRIIWFGFLLEHSFTDNGLDFLCLTKQARISDTWATKLGKTQDSGLASLQKIIAWNAHLACIHAQTDSKYLAKNNGMRWIWTLLLQLRISSALQIWGDCVWKTQEWELLIQLWPN